MGTPGISTTSSIQECRTAFPSRCGRMGLGINFRDTPMFRHGTNTRCHPSYATEACCPSLASSTIAWWRHLESSNDRTSLGLPVGGAPQGGEADEQSHSSLDRVGPRGFHEHCFG